MEEQKKRFTEAGYPNGSEIELVTIAKYHSLNPNGRLMGDLYNSDLV